MSVGFRRVLGMIALLSASTASCAGAGAPVRVRGTIERVEGDTYIVKARGGAELKVKLAEKAMVVALIKASLADIKQGSYVGVAGMPQAGRQPEGARGAHLPRGHARRRRRAPRLGPAALQHHDQRQRRADRRFERRPGADAQIQGRGEEDRRSARHARSSSTCRATGASSSPAPRIFIAAAVKQPDGTPAGAARERRPRRRAADVRAALRHSRKRSACEIQR